MLTVLSNCMVFLAMIALGYVLKQRGIFQPEHRKLFIFLMLNITMPCAVIASFDMNLQILPLLGAFVIGGVGCLLMDLLSMYLTRNRPGKERAGALLLSNGYYAAPFTMPFVQVNMVPAATMILAVFDMAQGFFNMGFNYALGTALAKDDKKVRLHPLMVLKAMGRSTIIVVYVLLLILSLLRVQLPSFVLNFAGKVGGANLFFSMMFVGMVLDFRLDRAAIGSLLRALGLRYAGVLVFALLCFFVLPIDRLTAQVLTLGFLAPVSSAAIAYSEGFGCDMRVTGAASSLSFLISIAAYTVLFLIWA